MSSQRKLLGHNFCRLWSTDGSYGPVTFIGYGRPVKVKKICLKKQKVTLPQCKFLQNWQISQSHQEWYHKVYNTKPITKFTTQQSIKQCCRCLGGWSSRYYLSVCRGARSTVIDQTTEYGKPASIEEHQNESKWMTWKTQMIWNVPSSKRRPEVR
jgi:hypothetical protein